MGACCSKEVVTATAKAYQAVAGLAKVLTRRFGFFLYSEKDGNILRYYLRNLSTILTDNLPFRENDELLYINGNAVVNSKPEEVSRAVQDISPGKPTTMISCRQTGDGTFTYNYVEGTYIEPMYPELNRETEAQTGSPAALKFRSTSSFSTSDPIRALPSPQVGYYESWIRRGQFFKYDPQFGNVRISPGLQSDDVGFKFWRCRFLVFELLRASRTTNPYREACRPESLPLFLSTSAGSLSWEFRPAGQYGQPLIPSPEVLFEALPLPGGLVGVKFHHPQAKYLKLSGAGLELDQESPHVSAEARFYFWDANP